MTDIIVLGASGMLGHVVCDVLSRRHRVVGLVRGSREAYADLETLCGPRFSLLDRVDSQNPAAFRRCMDAIGADIVVNCAGLIKQRPECADPTLALRANALLPRTLAAWCDRHSAKLIHISTDCVFSGALGYYSEAHEPDPVDLYGVSKLLGEIYEAPHLTLRTSLIGAQRHGTEGLFAWFLAQRGRTVKGFQKAIFSGLTTGAFAQLLLQIIDDHNDLTGLFHVASEPISKFDLLVEIERRLRLGIRIAKDDSVVCDRSLDGSRFAAATGISIHRWDAMLDELCVRQLEPAI